MLGYMYKELGQRWKGHTVPVNGTSWLFFDNVILAYLAEVTARENENRQQLKSGANEMRARTNNVELSTTNDDQQDLYVST